MVNIVAESPIESPLSFTIVFGNLPDGVVLNSTTGEITGTPTVEGLFHFVVRAEDEEGNFTDRAFRMNIINVSTLATTFDTDTTTFDVDGTTFTG